MKNKLNTNNWGFFVLGMNTATFLMAFSVGNYIKGSVFLILAILIFLLIRINKK